MVEHAVLASANAKNLLQQLAAVLGRRHIRKRAEILLLTIGRTTKIGQARIVMPGQHQIRISFVVAEQNVVARLERLNQIVFQQQRLGLGGCDGGFNARNVRHHQPNARRQITLLEIRRHPLLQRLRLAHIQQLPRRIVIAVHPRQQRQGGKNGMGIESFHKTGRLKRSGIIQAEAENVP